MSNAGGDHRVQDRLEGLDPGLGRDAVAEVEDMTGIPGVVRQDLPRGGVRRGGLAHAPAGHPFIRILQGEAMALAEPNVVKFIEGQAVKKVIIVPGKIVNIVVG
jgi:hypothetical protein